MYNPTQAIFMFESMTRLYYRFWVLLGALVLAGCHTITSIPELPKYSSLFPYQEDLFVSGRLFVHYTKAQDEFDTEHHRSTALSLIFHWEQRQENIRLTLLSPIGHTVAILQITPKITTLQHHGTTVTEEHPERLLARYLGMPLPIQPLRYWLQGYNAKRDPLPFYQDIVEDGWTLFYDKVEVMDSKARAKRLHIKRILKDALITEIDVRIVLDEGIPLEGAK